MLGSSIITLSADRASMRRWFALTLLASMLSSPVAVIGCPVMHHDQSSAHGEHASAASDQPAHHHGSQTDARRAPDAGHESDGRCMMIASCTSIAMPRTARLNIVVEFRVEPRSPTTDVAYANPALGLVTPPPKSA